MRTEQIKYLLEIGDSPSLSAARRKIVYDYGGAESFYQKSGGQCMYSITVAHQ